MRQSTRVMRGDRVSPEKTSICNALLVRDNLLAQSATNPRKCSLDQLKVYLLIHPKRQGGLWIRTQERVTYQESRLCDPQRR